MRLRICVLALIVLLPLEIFGEEAKKEEKNPRKEFEKLELKNLKIAEPIKITEVMRWKDGGSFGIEIEDADKKTHKFAIDGRERDNEPGKKVEIRDKLWLGVHHPSRDGGKAVARDSQEAKELYAVLLRWVNKHPKKELLLDKSKWEELQKDRGPPYLWDVQSFFLKLEERLK